MEYRVIRWKERDRLSTLHPEVWHQNPELAQPVFTRNPVPVPDDFPYFFYILDGENIAGFRRAVPDIARMGDVEFDWAWNFDLFIEPAYRGQGIGRRLVQRQILELGKIGFISGAAFSAPATLRIYERLGFAMPGHAPRMCLVRNAYPFLRGRIPNDSLAFFAGCLGNTVLSLSRSLRALLHRRTRFLLKEISQDEYRDFHDRLRRPRACNSWAASADWVLSRIGKDDGLYRLSRIGEGDPCALLVLRQRAVGEALPGTRVRTVERLKLMHPTFLDGGTDVAGMIASSLVHGLVERKADIVEVISSSPELLAELRARGFRSRGAGMSFAYKAGDGMNVPTGDKLEDWELTAFTSDGFMIE